MLQADSHANFEQANEHVQLYWVLPERCGQDLMSEQICIKFDRQSEELYQLWANYIRIPALASC